MEEDSKSKEKLLTDSLERSETITAPPQIQPFVAYQTESVSITPHSYLILSSIVAIFCAIFSISSLVCSIPAIIFSLQVSITLESITKALW